MNKPGIEYSPVSDKDAILRGGPMYSVRTNERQLYSVDRRCVSGLGALERKLVQAASATIRGREWSGTGAGYAERGQNGTHIGCSNTRTLYQPQHIKLSTYQQEAKKHEHEPSSRPQISAGTLWQRVRSSPFQCYSTVVLSTPRNSGYQARAFLTTQAQDEYRMSTLPSVGWRYYFACASAAQISLRLSCCRPAR